MEGACRSAARLFGLPAVRADGVSLPLRTASIGTAWCLVVLCCVDAVIHERHQHEKAYRQETEQQERLTHLLTSGQVTSQLLHAVRSG